MVSGLFSVDSNQFVLDGLIFALSINLNTNSKSITILWHLQIQMHCHQQQQPISSHTIDLPLGPLSLKAVYMISKREPEADGTA